MYYSVDLPAGADEPANQRPEDAGRLSILNDVSGAFRPNILTAFMGETGAGKTTLLDVLADRKTGGKIEGDIRVNVRSQHNALTLLTAALTRLFIPRSTKDVKSFESIRQDVHPSRS